MTRLFVAIDLPEQVKSALAGFAHDLPAARWVGAEELHLTLRFIGEVDDPTFAAIRNALAAVRFSAFPLTLCDVGHFPPGRRAPRVIWVGMNPCAGLAQLQRDVELALIDAGIPPDERRFSPHITLARLKEGVPSSVERFEKLHAGFACPAFEVDEFILYSSLLTRSGAIHTKEAVYRCR